MYRRILNLLSVVAIVVACVPSLWAQTDPAATPPKNPREKQPATAPRQGNGQQGQAYLGVGYIPVPKAVASQLSANFPEVSRGEGVMITEISPNSPAAKAGVRPYDIVISLDNQSVGSPDQFMTMINREAPGREVTLKIVRAAKSEDMKATLGERPSGVVRGQSPAGEASQGGGPEQATADEIGWESFDSLTLSRTDKDHFKADVSYRDDQGKTKSRSFQGTRDEIRRDIMSEKDLPKSEQHQLLGALHLPMEMWGNSGADSQNQERR